MLRSGNRVKNLSDQPSKRIVYLILGFVENTLSSTEHDELDHWVCASETNLLLFEKLTDPHFLAGINHQKTAAFARLNLKKIQDAVLSKTEPEGFRQGFQFFCIVAGVGFLMMMAGIIALLR